MIIIGGNGMERFTLAQAAEWTKGEARGEAALTAVTTDSRQIPPEALFLPIKGERFDAHDFIGKAIENGAAAVMSHRENEEYPVPALYVENTSQALLDLAGGYRMMCGGKVVGVTGSVGKTTTKELLYAVLSQGFRAQKTEGNLNNEIGLPLTLMRMTRDTEVLVAEMGMNHFGELSRMTAAAKPNLAVITNIGTSHIEFLGSREGICKAKLEILEGLQEGGAAVLCGDEPLLWDKRESLGCKVVTYGIENSACDLTADLHSDGTFDIVNNGLAAAHLYIRQCFPTAAVLVMSVSDRSVKSDSGFVPMDSAPYMAAAQRQAAQNSGAAFWSAYDAMQSLGGMAQFVANGWAGKDYTHINFAGGRRVAWALYDAINRGAEQHPPFTPVAHDNVIDTRKISHLEMMLRQAARPRMQKP